MFKDIRAAAFLFVFALAAAAQSPAQNWNKLKALAVGTSVRISVGSRTISGQIQGVTDDSLTVNSGKGQEMFARQEVMQVSAKKNGHSRRRNTLMGLGIGAGVGLIVGVATKPGCAGFICPTRGQDAAVGAIALGAIGTVIGAVIPTGGWREVYKQ